LEQVFDKGTCFFVMPVLLFFEVGAGELLLIMIFVLIFFGSKNIPQIARGLGKGMREIKDASNSIRSEIAREANKVNEETGIKKEIETIRDDINKNIQP
jgi:sec-independent protein translocase protein TatA